MFFVRGAYRLRNVLPGTGFKGFLAAVPDCDSLPSNQFYHAIVELEFAYRLFARFRCQGTP